MDLRFSKAKRELIKEIELSQDEEAIKLYLEAMRAKRLQIAAPSPMSMEQYQDAIREGLDQVDRGDTLSMEESFSRFKLDDK